MFRKPPRSIIRAREEDILNSQIEILDRVYLDISFKTDNPNQEIVEACRKVVEYLYKQRRELHETI